MMLKGIDQNKDQTYFLCQLNQKQLQASLFPLGNITKQKVRKIAEELDLPVAHKKDSTGICFIGERDFKQFLQNYIPAKPGKMVDNPVTLTFIDENTVKLEFDQPVKSVTPGQAAVFYDGDVCLGGGTIEKVYKDGKEIEYL